jgi:hypothetical protein
MPTTANRRRTPTTTRTAASRRPGTARPGPKDAIATIKADHQAVSSAMREYETFSPTALKRKRATAERIIRDLSIHAAIEEELLYPAARKRLGNGSALVQEAKTEHRQLKRLLDRLDKMDADDPRADGAMAAVKRAVQQHVKEEEGPGGILQGLRKEMSRDELIDLGKQLRAAKKMAPTRPHPNAPDSPPANVLVGGAAAVVDRTRDAVTGRGKARSPKPRATARRSTR